MCVYFDRALKREVAIKRMLPELASNFDAADRFLSEGRALSKLKHPNVVDVMSFGVDRDGTWFLVMELLQGQTLCSLLDVTVRETQRPIAPPRAAALVLQACEGLCAVHRARLVHRDVKPENLFVVSQNDGIESVKLIDFGIAKVSSLTGDNEPRTQSGDRMGSLAYMSPEQVLAKSDIDHRTDIYSLGVVLYELLSGANPHSGTQPGDVFAQILRHAPKPLEQFGICMPEGLAAVVARAMARDRRDRYQQAAEFADALRPFAPANLWLARPDHMVLTIPGESPSPTEDRISESIVPESLSPTVRLSPSRRGLGANWSTRARYLFSKRWFRRTAAILGGGAVVALLGSLPTGWATHRRETLGSVVHQPMQVDQTAASSVATTRESSEPMVLLVPTSASTPSQPPRTAPRRPLVGRHKSPIAQSGGQPSRRGESYDENPYAEEPPFGME